MACRLLACDFKDLPKRVWAFLSETFPQRQVNACFELTKGLSNNNYLLVIEQEKYLLKSYQSTFPAQSLVLQSKLATNITNVQEVVAWDKDAKLALFNYVDEFESHIEDKAIAQLIRTLALIHQFSFASISPSLNLTDALDNLPPTFKQKFNSEFKFSRSSLAQFPEDIGYCHNDLVKENCIASETGFVVIDFEYAAYGDVYFDLAALVSSFELTALQINSMLNTYYAQKNLQIPAYAKDKLTVYRMVYSLLCIAWYEEQGEAEKAASHIEQLKSIGVV